MLRERLTIIICATVVSLGGAGSCSDDVRQAADGGAGRGGAGGLGGRGGSANAGSGGVGGGCVEGSFPNDFIVCGVSSDGACSDTAPRPQCMSGQWVCPPGSGGPPAPCRCTGPREPGCTCTDIGWQCGLGGAGGRGGAGGQGGAAGAGGAGGVGGGAGGGAGGVGGGAGGRGGGAGGVGGGAGGVGGGAGGVGGGAGGGRWRGRRWRWRGRRRRWRGRRGGAAGTGGVGGGSGGASGAGGSGVSCAAVTTQVACDARSDCHSVFEDPHNCACAALGCCARFARCANGDRAQCTNPGIECERVTPYCELPYVVSYTGTCYEGCVRSTDCMPVP